MIGSCRFGCVKRFFVHVFRLLIRGITLTAALGLKKNTQKGVKTAFRHHKELEDSQSMASSSCMTQAFSNLILF